MFIGSRVVDLHVVDETSGKDYGVFKARIRDFDTELSVQLKVDALLAERGIEPDKASSSSRSLFYALALFAVTCEGVPNGEDPSKFAERLYHDQSPVDAFSFLGAYASALVKAEERFRQGPAPSSE